jgi:transposase
MTHSTSILPRSVDYDQTLVLAIELSNKSWVLAAQVPGLSQTKAKRTIEPDKNDLLAAIDGYRIRAAAAGRSVKRVITSYEAGWCGFWLARWLMAHGIEVHVVQPSSVPVDRRMRRGKSDGIDAELLLRLCLPGFAASRASVRWCRSRTKPMRMRGGVSGSGVSWSPSVSAS